MASRLPPSGGAQNACITSAEVMDSCTTLRSGPFTVAEADQRDDEQGLDDEEHAGRPPEDVGEEDVGGPREVGPGLERRLRERTAAPGNDERGGGQPEAPACHGVERRQVTLPLRRSHPGARGPADAVARASGA